MKRLVVVSIVVFAIVVLLITLMLWLSGSGKNWKTINHPTYGISFEAPANWDIKAFEFGKGRVTGSFNSGDTVAYLNISLAAVEDPNEQSLLNSVLPFTGEHIERGGLTGVSYTGKVIEEGGGQEWEEPNDNSVWRTTSETQFLENSYLQGRKFIVSSGIIGAECVILGPDYKSYISTCNGILNSIKKSSLL